LTGYFAVMLLAGSLSVAAKETSGPFGVAALDAASIVLIFGATVSVSAAVVLAAACTLRED
jgi:hypothetical protein